MTKNNLFLDLLIDTYLAMGYSAHSAKEIALLQLSTTKRALFIKNLMNDGIPYATAKYAWSKNKHGEEYNPRDHACGYKYEWVENINLDDFAQHPTNDGYSGLYINIKIDGEWARLPVAAVVWMQHFKKDVPKGYIINHGEKGPLCNDLDNLSLMLHRDNTKLKNRKFVANQYSRREVTEDDV